MINQQGAIPVERPSGDLVTYFDNMGKYILKDYECYRQRINQLHFQLDSSNWQGNKVLMPGRWREKYTVRYTVQERMKTMRQSSLYLFQEYQFIFNFTLAIYMQKVGV